LGDGRNAVAFFLPSRRRKKTSHALPSSPQRILVPETRRIESAEIHSAIGRLAQAIRQRHADNRSIFLLGIANGGIELAKRLAREIPHARAGIIDISFHRDDIGRHPIPKEFAPTQIPGDVNNAQVILVDDVLFSGRTVKAALDELFDHGRPHSVELAILVDRGNRKLPISADYCGITATTTAREKVVVSLDPADPTKDAIEIRASAS
jgi:pyrimidine operon attenuation protein / uracil phosphoribosyltransferase